MNEVSGTGGTVTITTPTLFKQLLNKLVGFVKGKSKQESKGWFYIIKP